MPDVMRTAPPDWDFAIDVLNGFLVSCHFFFLVCFPLALCLSQGYVRYDTVFGRSPLHKWFTGVFLTLWLASFIAFVRVAQLVLDKPEFNWLLHVFMFYVDACIIYLVLPSPGPKLPVLDEEEGLLGKVRYSGLRDARKQKAKHVVAEKDDLLEKVEYMVLKVEDEEDGSL
ncbi:hypothetical protein NW762_005860 [Fusarium torreyae]|uniref:Uncharacterized protein n=1 Tax=Fusarium torreyae TaxID=1237075 RepID=A0A9W8VFF0_9HYPO|nr:hypothetical protein NW762_005860 [Fusarium torreyae]